MEWEFTPEEVIKGEASYALEHFRADLAAEIRMNLSPPDETAFERAYALIYDLCHWLAIGRAYEDFIGQLSDDPAATRLANMVREPMAPNADMLGAILQRMIMDRVEGGMPLEAALQSVAEAHDAIASRLPERTGASS